MKKYISKLKALIKEKTNLNGRLFYYLGYFLGKEYFLSQNAIYVTTYGAWDYDIMKNQPNVINLVDLYAVKLLKEYPKTDNDIEFETILKDEKYNYSKSDFLTWIDEPAEIIEAVDLPYYKIIQILLNKKNPNKKTPLAKLVKQTISPKYFLHEWAVHRIFCKPDKFSNIWVYDHPEAYEEPYFFLTDSPWLQETTKIAVLDFKTPTYRKKDYDKGIYKRWNVKRKFWKLDENYIKELMEFLNAPANLNDWRKSYKDKVKTNWQKLIFEYNYNSAGWDEDNPKGWAPEIEPLSFELKMPDYTKLFK